MLPVLDRPLRHVAFRFDGRRVPNARSVSLVASFNRWDSAAEPLRRQPDGWWTTEVLLSPGEYEYMFLVDGAPWNDPLDDGRAENAWGGHYSVRVVV